MKATHLLSTFVLATSALIGCVDTSADPETSFPGTIKSESSVDLENAPLCDVETPCPDGLECIFIGALDGESPICVDIAIACDALDCGDAAECLILESYPAQMMCSGSDPNEGSGDDCSIDSNGNTECPD